MPTFPLNSSPWLPCISHDGKTANVSLREALVRAQHFADCRTVRR